MTWRPSASARSCSPTARAVWPPMPASTSSKTSVAGAGLGGDAHQREHHARELAARRRLAQRAGGHAGVRRDQELDLVAAGRAGPSRGDSPTANAAPSIASSPRRSRRRRPAAAAASARASCSAAARSVELARARPRAALRASSSASSAPVELGAARAARLGVLEHRGDRAAVLALEPVEQRQPLLDLVEPARRRVDALAVAAQLAREVVGLDGERLRPVGERVERRVDARSADSSARRGRGQRERRARRRRPASPSPAPPARPPPRRAALEVAQPLALGLQRRPPRPRSARRARSPRAPTPAGRARGRARRRGPAAPRARAAAARASA